MLAFLVELRRRNVLRVAAAYLVAAWLLVQVAATLLPLFGFDEDAVLPVVVLLAVGFVPALVFSWAFEITPEGLKRERDVDREQSIVVHTGRKIDRIIMVVLSLALGYFVFDRFVLSPSREAAGVQSARQEGRSEALVESYGDRSIAVLPFVDMSPGHDQEYLSDGIAEELLNLLAKIPELRVISRSSAFSFKDRNLKIPKIARQLNVAHILEGSVRRDGNRVRITAQLIDARSDTHLWSETYDRTMGDIFAVQDEIAAAVVEQLKLELKLRGPAPTARAAHPEAYALEMKARFLDREGSNAALAQSVEFHKLALAIDPSYASAWSELARTYTSQLLRGMLPAEQGLALQREAVAKALALDPDDLQAHVQLGWAAIRLERDLAAAARHLSRALSLDPENANALRAATALADALGRADEAVALARYALLNDPVTPASYYNLGVQYSAVGVGRFDDSLAALRTALRLSPDMQNLHALIALALLLKGEYEAALGEAELEEKAELRLASRALALHALGRKAESDAALRELEEEHADDSAGEIARVHAFRGESDRAFEWLDRAFGLPTFAMRFPRNDPLLVSLHDDPRWLPFLRRIGVAPEQVAAIRFNVKLPE